MSKFKPILFFAFDLLVESLLYLISDADHLILELLFDVVEKTPETRHLEKNQETRHLEKVA